MKWAIYGGATIGGLIGGYVPVVFFHASSLGSASIIGGAIGTLAGLVAGIALGRAAGW